MIVRENIPISSVSWLKSSYGNICTGIVKKYYEPKNTQELENLCREFYNKKIRFDLIGATSNIYFRPDYNSEVMISTRKINQWHLLDDCIICDCGTLVRPLSLKMIELGIQGFEGLIDLPGTVAASVYGNASCFSCSIAQLLIDAEVLFPDGVVKTVKADEFKFEKRSSVFKRREKNGVILTVRLSKTITNNPQDLMEIAKQNHRIRLNTQPGPNNNLGSNFTESNATFILKIISALGKLFECVLLLFSKNNIRSHRMHFQLLLLGKSHLHSYVYSWNRFIWKDEKAHLVFNEYVTLYKKLFKNSVLEIEIKENLKK